MQISTSADNNVYKLASHLAIELNHHLFDTLGSSPFSTAHSTGEQKATPSLVQPCSIIGVIRSRSVT